MEFDETPRFWYSRVALDTWTDFAFCSDKNLQSNFCKSYKEAKKIFYCPFLSLFSLLTPFLPFSSFLSLFDFPFFFLSILFLSLFFFKIWIHDSHYVMCLSLIHIRFSLKIIYLFSVQFILNELSLSNFLTSKIFVKISSLESLTTYHPETCKNF